MKNHEEIGDFKSTLTACMYSTAVQNFVAFRMLEKHDNSDINR